MGAVDITLHGMRFHALIGILEHERTIPQPLEVDLTVRCRAGAGVVDYRRLYASVRVAVETGPIDYLEELAERIARDALQDARVDRARVAVRKPHVALDGPLKFAEVAIVRRRSAER